MKKNTFISALLSATTLFFAISCGESGQNDSDAAGTAVETLSDEELYPMGFNPDTLMVTEGNVKNGQFFSTLLNSLGLGASETYALTQSCKSVFDVRTLRVGYGYKAYYTIEEPTTEGGETQRGDLRYLVYDRDRMSSVIFDCQAPYEAWIYEKPVTYVDRYTDVTISSSLWNDMRAADASPLLIVTLSDIYAWTIDFFGLQKGDQFKVLYQEKICDGEVIAVDTVRYAVFTHGNTEFPAILFDQNDGGNLWCRSRLLPSLQR